MPCLRMLWWCFEFRRSQLVCHLERRQNFCVNTANTTCKTKSFIYSILLKYRECFFLLSLHGFRQLENVQPLFSCGLPLLAGGWISWPLRCVSSLHVHFFYDFAYFYQRRWPANRQVGEKDELVRWEGEGWIAGEGKNYWIWIVMVAFF